MLSRTSPDLPEPGVTPGPGPEVERVVPAPRGPPPDPAQGQMLLQFGGYVEQQLHPLRLDIKINQDDINDMKDDVGNTTVNYREVREFVSAQEARIDGLLCRILKQDKTIERLRQQVEEFRPAGRAPRPTLAQQARDALAVLARDEAEDAPVTVRTRRQRYEAPLPPSSVSSPPSRASLPLSPPRPSLFAPPPSVRSASPLLPSSAAPVPPPSQPTSEEVERAIDFGMSVLSTPFCQYDSCAFLVEFD
jgi:hypothetical protein